MSESNQTNKRRHYFIKRGFQLKFILKFCLLLLLGVILSTGLLFLFSQGTLTSSFQHSRLQIQNTSLAILPAVIYTNLITLGLITVATIVVTLVVSHKIAGPMYRFEKELEAIGSGDLTKKIVLREKDEMAQMAAALNQMVASLRDKLSGVQQQIGRARHAAAHEQVSEELMRALDDLDRQIDAGFRI